MNFQSENLELNLKNKNIHSTFASKNFGNDKLLQQSKQKKLDAKSFETYDFSLLIGVLLLSLIGILFVWSSSKYNAQLQFGDSFHYVKTQTIAFGIGLFAMVGLSLIDADSLKKLAIPIFVVSIVLLALVFVPVLGVENYGAKRWLNLGFFTIQPSEYAKFGLIIFLAFLLSKYGVNTFGKFLTYLGIVFAFCLLIILEPNMSITMCVVLVALFMLFFCGAKIWHMLMLFLPMSVGVLGLVLLEPYRLKRLVAFVNPWENPLTEGYQLIQSYYSLGAGGLFGVGIGNSRQKFMFLPFSESDFILSVIGEETGFVGCLFLALLFVFIVYRGIKIARKADSRFSSYLAGGITSMIAIQSLMNFAVVCGAIPPTGLPLPFVSAGGSSLVAYMCGAGILLAVSKKTNTKFLRNP